MFSRRIIHHYFARWGLNCYQSWTTESIWETKLNYHNYKEDIFNNGGGNIVEQVVQRSGGYLIPGNIQGWMWL